MPSKKLVAAIFVPMLAPLLAPLLAMAAQHVDLSTVDKTDFAPGGTVRIEGSTGELNIEGWDQPVVEIQTDRYTWSDHAEKAKAGLDRVQVTKKLEGRELTITTAHKHFTDIRVNYRILVPRNTKLVVHHGTGSVVVYGVEGDIDATAKVGDVLVQLNEPAKYQIEASTNLGSIYSDFDGAIHHRRLGIAETQTPSPEGTGDLRHVTLHVKVAGGITIQKVAV